MRAPGLIVLLCGLLAACGEPRPGAPRPLSLEPSSAQVGAPMEVVIHGQQFLPLVQADYSDRERSRVDGEFSARLGEAALEDVTFVSTTELRGRVPAGLAPGRYTLVVVAPSGAEGHLDDAFQVLRPPAVRLALVTPPRTETAGKCSDAVELEAQDEHGQPGRLDAPLDVALTLSPAGTVSLFSDPECRQPLVSVRLEDGVPRRAVYFSGSTAPVTAALIGESSLGMVEQQVRVVPGKVERLEWHTVFTPQQVGIAFEVHANALDAFGNLTGDDLNTRLDTSPDAPLRCLSGCSSTRRPEFHRGVFSGSVAVDAPTQGVSLTLTLGNDTFPSNAFDVAGYVEGVALAFTTGPQRVAAGRCSAPVTVQLQDAMGRPTSANGWRDLSLRQAPPVLLTLFSDAACSQSLGNVALEPGTSQLTFHFSGQRAGMTSLTASSRGLSSAIQRQEVTDGPGASGSGPGAGRTP